MQTGINIDSINKVLESPAGRLILFIINIYSIVKLITLGSGANALGLLLIVAWVYVLYSRFRRWIELQAQKKEHEQIVRWISDPEHVLTLGEVERVQVAIYCCWLSPSELLQAVEAVQRASNDSSLLTIFNPLTLKQKGDTTCRFNSKGTAPIKCAVNPLGECSSCKDYERFAD